MSDRDKWDDRYKVNDLPWETGQPSAELQRVVQAEKIAPCRAIEFGCGSGTNAVWLAQQGFKVVGVDFSPTAIERAKARARDAKVAATFLCADMLAESFDFEVPFDFFFDRGCYHVLHRNGAGARGVEIVAGLTSTTARGLVLAGNAKEKREPGPPTVTEEEFRADWSPHFDILALHEFRFDLNLTDKDFRPLGWSALLRKRTS